MTEGLGLVGGIVKECALENVPNVSLAPVGGWSGKIVKSPLWCQLESGL